MFAKLSEKWRTVNPLEVETKATAPPATAAALPTAKPQNLFAPTPTKPSARAPAPSRAASATAQVSPPFESASAHGPSPLFASASALSTAPFASGAALSLPKTPGKLDKLSNSNAQAASPTTPGSNGAGGFSFGRAAASAASTSGRAAFGSSSGGGFSLGDFGGKPVGKKGEGVATKGFSFAAPAGTNAPASTGTRRERTV